MLYHTTFLRANSSFTWLIWVAGVVGAGELRASSGFALLHWNGSNGKGRKEGDLRALTLAFQGCPSKAGKLSSLQVPQPTPRAVNPWEHLFPPGPARQGALLPVYGWEHVPAQLRCTGMSNTQCHGAGSRQRDWGWTYVLSSPGAFS